MIVTASTVALKYNTLECNSAKDTRTLVAFLANADPAAVQYAQATQAAFAARGLGFVLVHCTRTQLETRILEANTDPHVAGIMVYYPVFATGQDQYLQNIVAPHKDVEGLCHTFRFNLYNNVRFMGAMKCIVPCTPLAIVKVLEHIDVYNSELPEGQRLFGRTITVINRSEVVGRPLAALLANDGARVYSADENGLLEYHRGDNLALPRHQVFETIVTLNEALAMSDTVITGVPSPAYKLDASLLKPGVVAVNFSTFKNMGQDVRDKASVFVPSVGKVTIAMLQRNLLRLATAQQDALKVQEGQSSIQSLALGV